jgi:hypothetical protein
VTQQPGANPAEFFLGFFARAVPSLLGAVGGRGQLDFWHGPLPKGGAVATVTWNRFESFMSHVWKRASLQTALFASACLAALDAGKANAVLVFEFVQQGADVALNISGSLTGVSPASVNSPRFNNQKYVQPNLGYIYASSSSNNIFGDQFTISGAQTIGTGPNTALTSYSGDQIQFAAFASTLDLPANYASGTPISGSGLFAARTLSSLGLSSTIPGLLGTWTVGTDSIEVRIGSAPAPAAAPGPLPLLGAGAAFAYSRQLRARLGKRLPSTQA